MFLIPKILDFDDGTSFLIFAVMGGVERDPASVGNVGNVGNEMSTDVVGTCELLDNGSVAVPYKINDQSKSVPKDRKRALA